MDICRLPADAGGIVGPTRIIELVFDPPVMEVSINYFAE